MRDGGAKPARGGYTYFVSDEQLRAFRRLTPEQRLRWLDEMREFSIETAPPRAKEWWRRLRAGR
jgi:hypothetical protein